MCSRILSYLINSKYLQFLKKITTLQRAIFVILGVSFVIFSVNNFEYLYYLKGLKKLFFC